MTDPRDSFKEDLEVGKIAEEYILKGIRRKYPKAKIMEGYFKECFMMASVRFGSNQTIFGRLLRACQ